jgi:hypothetical protein
MIGLNCDHFEHLKGIHTHLLMLMHLYYQLVFDNMSVISLLSYAARLMNGVILVDARYDSLLLTVVYNHRNGMFEWLLLEKYINFSFRS